MNQEKQTKQQDSKEQNLTEQNQSESQDASEPQEITALAQMTELAQRTQANFENYRKQTEKRIAEIKQFASREIIIQLLPIFDHFELALKNCHATKEELVNGLNLIYSQFNSFLDDNDVKKIDTEHQLFNPYFHEALVKVASDLPENTIIEEFQKGFTLHGQVIRHARVKISSSEIKSDHILHQEKHRENIKKNIHKEE